jgi:hypothetical protein
MCLSLWLGQRVLAVQNSSGGHRQGDLVAKALGATALQHGVFEGMRSARHDANFWSSGARRAPRAGRGVACVGELLRSRSTRLLPRAIALDTPPTARCVHWAAVYRIARSIAPELAHYATFVGHAVRGGGGGARTRRRGGGRRRGSCAAGLQSAAQRASVVARTLWPGQRTFALGCAQQPCHKCSTTMRWPQQAWAHLRCSAAGSRGRGAMRRLSCVPMSRGC